MGNAMTQHYNLYFKPEVTPFPPDGPKFDPLYGFAEGRPEKVMVATPEEMASAGLKKSHQNYCAHLYMEYKKCYRLNTPFIVKCEPQVHAYHDCIYKEEIDGWKDYERERRLMVRAERIKKRKAKEVIED